MSAKSHNAPVLPWKTRLYISILTTISDASCCSNGSVRRRLFNFFDPKVPPKGKPVNGVKTTDVKVDPTRNLWFRLFIPTESGDDISLPVILFFHGGGFSFLGPDSWVYDTVCRRIARKFQAIIVSVNYRLAPENRFPSQYEDGFDALKFFDERNFDGFPANADLTKCFVAGDSAGGNLAHHVAVRACKAEFKKVKVIGVIAIQPFFGGKERTESELRLTNVPLVSVERTDWVWKAFLPEGEDRDHEAVNVFGPKSEDISGLKFPATLVFVGGFDPLQDWQKRYYEDLKKHEKEAYLVEYPDGIHAFYLFPELPQASLLITEMNDFIQKQCQKSSEM